MNLEVDVRKCAVGWSDGVYLAITSGGWSRRVKVRPGYGWSRAGLLSEHTIHRHLANILRKLDLSSRAAAAAWGVRAGLV